MGRCFRHQGAVLGEDPHGARDLGLFGKHPRAPITKHPGLRGTLFHQSQHLGGFESHGACQCKRLRGSDQVHGTEVLIDDLHGLAPVDEHSREYAALNAECEVHQAFSISSF